MCVCVWGGGGGGVRGWGCGWGGGNSKYSFCLSSESSPFQKGFGAQDFLVLNAENQPSVSIPIKENAWGFPKIYVHRDIEELTENSQAP